MTCTVCYAHIARETADLHYDWHAAIEAALESLARNVSGGAA